MDIVQENNRRLDALRRREAACDPLAPRPGMSRSERMREDFEFWAASCVKIFHKDSRMPVPFVLNAGQRRVLAEFERQRRAHRPIRCIVLKSRQWGCSTLVVHYMLWLQLMHRENWHSVVCAHNLDTACQVASMYADALMFYPPDEQDPEQPLALASFRGVRSVKELRPRGCRISMATARRPDAVRGAAFSMAHLTEVAFWPETRGASPAKAVRSICASIARVDCSMVVMESTANGAGGFFYEEWLRAVAGESDKAPVFVPWHECGYFCESLTVTPHEFFESLDSYERGLWDRGLTLEQIHWYRSRLREAGGNRRLVMNEYPLTPDEAFANSLPPVFEPAMLERQRESACPPEYRAEIELPSGNLVTAVDGRLEVWADPCDEADTQVTAPYLASVDVGGNYEGADWCVVAVFDCRRPGAMELVAQWRGHVDADRLGLIAAALGRRYHNATLVVESNSLEARGLDVLERVAASGYRNLYRRRCLDAATGAESYRYGFHTNAETKTAAITDLTAALRDHALVERSARAVEEMAAYVRTPRGAMEATRGCHDDMVMTRAIAAYALRQNPPRPRRKFKIERI